MKQFNLEEYLKNPSRKLVTTEGRNARIVCTDFKAKYHSVLALIDYGEYECTISRNKEGRLYGKKELANDLFFAPEKHEGWINVYHNPDTGTTSFGAVLYNSRKEAEEVGKPDDYYVATAEIEWEE